MTEELKYNIVVDWLTGFGIELTRVKVDTLEYMEVAVLVVPFWLSNNEN